MELVSQPRHQRASQPVASVAARGRCPRSPRPTATTTSATRSTAWFVAAGFDADAVGTAGRFFGAPMTSASLTVDVPSGASVQQAYVYVNTIGSVAAPMLTMALDGTAFVAPLIGDGGPSCRGLDNHNRGYRGDVTALVTGSGTYTVTGVPSGPTADDDSQGRRARRHLRGSRRRPSRPAWCSTTA